MCHTAALALRKCVRPGLWGPGWLAPATFALCGEGLERRCKWARTAQLSKERPWKCCDRPSTSFWTIERPIGWRCGDIWQKIFHLVQVFGQDLSQLPKGGVRKQEKRKRREGGLKGSRNRVRSPWRGAAPREGRKIRREATKKRVTVTVNVDQRDHLLPLPNREGHQ